MRGAIRLSYVYDDRPCLDSTACFRGFWTKIQVSSVSVLSVSTQNSDTLSSGVPSQAVDPAALVIVLAAGAGTRMKSTTPKVLHPILGKPILGHVLDNVVATGADQVVVVVGHGREKVAEFLSENYSQVTTAVQEEQNGTGHAVRCAIESLGAKADELGSKPVVVIAGDTPLLTTQTLNDLVAAQEATGDSVTVLSAQLPDPTGYGRVVRDADGLVTAIVEHKDASEAELAIDEINSGMYAFAFDVLNETLGELSTDNSQGEEYLTDVLSIARGKGKQVGGFIASDPNEVYGINDKAQLAAAGVLLRDRVNEMHMRAGVTIVDPYSTWIAPGAQLAPDSVIERNTSIDDASVVETGAVVGPDTTLVATTVRAGATVLKSHVLGSEIGPEANVGPYTYLRPGSVLAEGAKVGAYVEVKNATIGQNSKVPHLSYVGDATIGEGTNIGAATIFANYDGVKKHSTVVGDHVRVGSDTMLVAPVTVGDGAYTAAGSVVTQDVPPGAIAIGRAIQVNKDRWVAANRPGTKSAEAAQSAGSNGTYDQDRSTSQDNAESTEQK